MKSTSVHVGCPGWKEARGSLVKLIEQAQPGIGLLLQHKEKFIRIMLHANADSGVEIFYMIISCSWTELHELIITVVEYLIVSKLCVSDL